LTRVASFLSWAADPGAGAPTGPSRWKRNLYDFDVQYLDGTLLNYCQALKDQRAVLPVSLVY